MTEMNNCLVRLESVSRGYGVGSVVSALSDITLSISRGERVAIMGPSGSGKTTLLNLICGLDEPTFGTVWFEGAALSQLSDDERTRLRREKIGMIFQTFNLLPTLSALENVALPLRLQGLRRKAAEKSARLRLEQVGVSDSSARLPDAMSGGERQRVAIARALVFDPPLLLADEPTGNLDSVTGQQILDLLDQLHHQVRATIVLVTHNPVAAAHCQRLLTLRDGRITADSPLTTSAPEVA